ncbi:Glyco_tran_10_N domain-containing protein [Meloidogyne graminicola]|uniref:Fucosyltransferase n=1 Tax=Meloidogyne graminicola TaxID=189291 RepID=A0A8S9ZPJ9_9BILA|nr:Glyco_tran_10_N domain-containing protein [Meloidogyne graminicola]
MPLNSNFLNMSFGFRMDTPGASPYGFAALLDQESKPNKDKLYEYIKKLIAKKNKPIAWFVSHCSTHSGREWIAKEMQKYINIDIYGNCGPLQCSKGGKCLQMLDTDYYFYFAAENSLCLDYLTEKIWDQGLGYFSVPIVLKRSFVEHLLPPASFIAVDDYQNIEEFTFYLLDLINKPQEYMQYLLWRFDYVSIKMNSNTDPRAEKLFGVCQICKLTQMNPRPIITISSPINEWWDKSCDPPEYLINKFKKKEDEQ